MNDRTGIIYHEIAQKVIELFERNGFTAEYPVNPFGLRMEIAAIIGDTIGGNTNYNFVGMSYEEYLKACSHDSTIAGWGPGYPEHRREEHKAQCDLDSCACKGSM